MSLPPRLSDNEMGQAPRTIYPEFVGSIRDGRLHGAYAIAVDGINAFVASRWCKTCVVMVNVMDPALPIMAGCTGAHTHTHTHTHSVPGAHSLTHL